MHNSELFERNIPAISEAEQLVLAGKRVAVAGCGGLGGYCIEHMARTGVGAFTLIDPDVFELSNMNRQLLCTLDSIGQSKARQAAERVRAINPVAHVSCLEQRLNEENAPQVLASCDVVIDALDSGRDKRMLEQACRAAALPLVHGAIQGWRCQVCTCLPGSSALSWLYEDSLEPSGKESLSVTAAFCASLQASEACKILCGRAPSLADELLVVDLEDMSIRRLPLCR